MKTVLSILCGMLLVAGLSYSQEYIRTVGPVATSNFNTSITVPAYNGTAPLDTVTVTIDLTVDRSYAVRNFAPDAVGIVVFNAQVAGGSYVRARVLDPVGSFLCTADRRLDERRFDLEEFGGLDSASFAESFTRISTQITTVNPDTFTGNGTITLPVQLSGITAVQQFSGFCVSRQSQITTAVIKVKYN